MKPGFECDFFGIWVETGVESWGIDWFEAFKTGQTSYDLAEIICKLEHGMPNQDLGSAGIYTFQYFPRTLANVLFS